MKYLALLTLSLVLATPFAMAACTNEEVEKANYLKEQAVRHNNHVAAEAFVKAQAEQKILEGDVDGAALLIAEADKLKIQADEIVADIEAKSAPIVLEDVR